MVTRILTADELDEWDTWYSKLEGAGPYHSPAYAELLAGNFEYESEWAELFVYGDDEAFVYYPYIRRSLEDLSFAETALDSPAEYSDIVSMWYWGGPLLSKAADESLASEFVSTFSEYCRDEGIISEFIRFDPNRENHEPFDELDPTFNRETVIVDLTKSKDRIWDEFETRNRNAIRQARETEITVEPTTDPAEYEAFYEIYSNAMDAKDASAHYRFPFSWFKRLFANKDLSTLLVARYDDSVIGGSVLVHENELAHDYLRASNPDYWDLRVNNLLCYRALIAMHESGRERFDFQGGRPGVFKFKKGFSTTGRGEFHIGTQTHLPETYSRLVDAAEATGIDTNTDYFPAYRKTMSIS